MKNKKYNIGLDIGSTSIGWAISEITPTTTIVEKSGVVRWSNLEPNENKRGARSLSRMNRRRKSRKKRLIEMLIKNNVITKELLTSSTTDYLKNNYQINCICKQDYIIDENELNKDLKITVKSFYDNQSSIDKLFNKINLIIQKRIQFDTSYLNDFLESSEYITKELLKQQLNENYLLLKVNNTQKIDNLELILILSGYLHRRGNNDYFPDLDKQGIHSLLKQWVIKFLQKEEKKFIEEKLKSLEKLTKVELQNIKLQNDKDLFTIFEEKMSNELKLVIQNDSKASTSIKNSNVINHVISEYFTTSHTVAETKLYIQYIATLEKNKNNKVSVSIRNKDQYLFNFTRFEIFNDLKLISKLIDINVLNNYKELFFEQKSFFEGPNFNIDFDESGFVKNKQKNTPIVFKRYGKNFINETIGWCTFENEHRRSSKLSLSFEVYKIINAFKNIKINYNKQVDKKIPKENISKFLITEFTNNPGLKFGDYLKLAEKQWKGLKLVVFGLQSNFSISFTQEKYNFFELNEIQDEIYNIVNSNIGVNDSVMDQLSQNLGMIYEVDAALRWLEDIKANEKNIFHKYYQNHWDDLILSIYSASKNPFKEWSNISNYFINKNMKEIIETSLSSVITKNYKQTNTKFEEIRNKYKSNLAQAYEDPYFYEDETGEVDDLKYADFVKYLEFISGQVNEDSKYFYTRRNNAVKKQQIKSQKNKILPVQPINTISNMEVRYTLNQVRKIIWNLNKEYNFIENDNLENIVIEMTTGSDTSKENVISQRYNTLMNKIFFKYFYKLSKIGLNAYKFSLILDQSNRDFFNNAQIIKGLEDNMLNQIQEIVNNISKIKVTDIVNYDDWVSRLSNLSNIDFQYFNDNWQIDHILPISRSKDNSKTNKWFISSKDNQNKLNDKTAFDLWKSKNDTIKKNFEDRVKKIIKSEEKRTKLKTYDFDQFNDSHFIAKQLTNTSFSMNVTKSYLENYFIEGKVMPVSFKVVSQVKKQLNDTYKNRNYSLTHHALDAQIISSITRSDIFKISNIQKSRVKHNLITTEKELKLLQTNENNFIYKREEVSGEYKTVEYSLKDIKTVDEFNNLLKNSLYPNFYFISNDLNEIKTYGANLFNYEQYLNIFETLLTNDEKNELSWNQLSTYDKLQIILEFNCLNYIIQLGASIIFKHTKNETNKFLENILNYDFTNNLSEKTLKLFKLNIYQLSDLINGSNESDIKNLLTENKKLIEAHIIGKQMYSKNLRDIQNNIIDIKKYLNIVSNSNTPQKFEFKYLNKDVKTIDENKIQIEWKTNKKTNRKLNKDTSLSKSNPKGNAILENIKIIKKFMNDEIIRKDIKDLFKKVLNYIRYFETSSGTMEKSELLFLEVYQIKNIQYFLPIYPVDYNKIVKGNEKLFLIPQTNNDQDVLIFNNYQELKRNVKFIGRYYTNSEIVVEKDNKQYDLLYTTFAPSSQELFFKAFDENNAKFNIKTGWSLNKKDIKNSWKTIKIIKKS